MKTLKLLAIVFASLASSFSFSQNYNMSNSSISTCSGTFYDSGGNGGDYDDDEDYTMTICPDSPGSFVELNFTSFATEDGYDFLTIYDGANTSAPSLGTYDGTTSPGLVQGSNASGCVTLVFTSDDSFFSSTDSGWSATISCTEPCQQVIAGLTSAPAINGVNIDVCQNEAINFNGVVTFPENNNSYTQSAATSDFTWSFGDGTTATTQNSSHSYSSAGIYQVDLEIVDVNGCSSTNDIDILVRVSDDPVFTGTQAAQAVICLGETNTITGAVTPTQIALDCTPPQAGITFLPDGTGTSYSTSITVDCFNAGQTLTNANQISDVCLDLEHSYMGDLNIALVCPDGTSIDLLDYGANMGGGTILGEPIATDLPIDGNSSNTDPGVGYTYCFAPSSSSGHIYDASNATNIGNYTDGNGNSSTGVTQANPGTYEIDGNWGDLVGCPLNGDWTIVVEDNLGSDNGHIFEWGVTFDGSITPGSTQYIPPVITEEFQADPTITATSGNTITVEPTTVGQACYTYEMTDEFGCTYDTTVCFTVLDPSDPACPNCAITNFTANISACDPATNTYTITGVVDIVDAPGSGTLTISDCNGNQDVFSAPFAASYNYTVTSNTPDGAACDITAVFSADPACTANIPFNAPECICNIDDFTVSISACDGANEYELTGTVEFTSAPATGNLIVEDCNGNQDVFDVTTITSPINYTISNLDADGTACDVTVYFTDDMACTANIPYTAPASCACDVEVGTFTLDTDGTVTGNHVILCDGNFFTLTANGDFVPPTDLTAGDPSEPLYDPTLLWVVYSCPPSVGLVPSPGVDVFADPCVLGIVGTNDIGDLNDMSFINSQAPGTFTDNIIYFVPLTSYSDVDNIYTYTTNAAGMPCYELGTPYSVQYIPEITETTVEDCQAGTVTTTVNGGSPELLGTNFTASNLVPATASFANTTAADGGDIVVTGLVDGDNYSFDIMDENGCPVTITGTFTGPEDPAFDYAQTEYCANETDPSANITGDTGGTFTSTGGLVINAGTGLIDLSASTPGTYTVTYTTPDPVCFSTSTFDLTINPVDIPTFTLTDYCEGDANTATITGTTGGTFAFNPAVADGATIDATTGSITNGVGGTTYTVEYTTAGICPLSSTEDVTVNVVEDPSFTVTDFCEGDANAATITGSTGGTFAFNPAVADGATIDATTGSITNGVGGTTYTVEYSFGGPCPQSSTQDVTVNALDIPTFTLTDYCEGDANTATITGTTGGTFAFNPAVADGATIDAATGSITNGVGGTTYTVEYTTAGICPLSSTEDVTVNALPTPTIIGALEYCTGTDATLSADQVYSGYDWVTGGTNQNETVTIADNPITITVTDGNGCIATSPAVNVVENSVINTYDTLTICQGEAIDIHGNMESVAGDYPLNFVLPTGCDSTSNVHLIVNALPIVDAGNNVAVCEDVNTINLSGSGADSYSWDNSVVDGVDFTQAVGTITYTVTGTDLNGCTNTDVVDVTVNAMDIPTFTLTDYCEGDANAATITGTTGGTFTFNPAVADGATINATTGSITNGVGGTTYTVEYTTAGICPLSSTEDVLVNIVEDPTFTVTDFCEGDANAATITGSTGGTFAFNPAVVDGATIDATTGSITNGVGGTTYTIEYSFGGPCPQSSTQDVTVNALDIPTFTLTDYCEGDANTATITGTTGGTFTFNPAVADGATINATTGSITNGVGGTTYTVEYTTAGICPLSSTEDVTVNALPSPLITGGLQYCLGTQAILSTDQVYTGYNWSNGATTQNASFTDVDNPITITVTDANGCVNTSPAVNVVQDEIITDHVFTICDGDQINIHGNMESVAGMYSNTFTTAQGCDSTSNVQLVVNALPNVSAGNDVTVCEDANTITLTASGANTYSWNNSVTNGLAFTQAPGSVTYTVTGTDLNGCINTDDVDVTVNPLPGIFAGDDVSVCEGVEVTLSGSMLLVGTGPVNYSWTGAVLDGVAFTPGVGTTTYTVTGTDNFGCTNTDNVDVTVTPLPNVSAGSDETICEGSDIILSGQGAVTYTWDNGVTNGQPFTPFADQVYTVTGTDANGCQNTDNVIISIESNPIPTFIGDDLSGCSPHTVVFTNTTPGNTSGCIWDFGNGATAGNCGPVTITYPEGGTYSVSLTTTSDNGCVGTTTLVDYIYVEDAPIASFYTSSYEVSALNTEVQFTNTSTGATSYEWSFGDASQSTTIENPLHTFPEEDQANYIVQLIAYSSLGCTDTAYATITVNEELIYYIPNTFTPDEDDFNETFKPIFTDGYDPYDYTLLIFNRWGEILFESHDTDYGWDGTYNGAQVQDGTYTWKIEFKTTMNDKRIDIVGHVNKIR